MPHTHMHTNAHTHTHICSLCMQTSTHAHMHTRTHMLPWLKHVVGPHWPPQQQNFKVKDSSLAVSFPSFQDNTTEVVAFSYLNFHFQSISHTHRTYAISVSTAFIHLNPFHMDPLTQVELGFDPGACPCERGTKLALGVNTVWH